MRVGGGGRCRDRRRVRTGAFGYDEKRWGKARWVTFPWSVTGAPRGGVALTLFWLGGPHVFAFNAPAEHREGWFGLATRAGCASGWLRPDSGGGYVERSCVAGGGPGSCTAGAGWCTRLRTSGERVFPS